jgi:hypothetical protein
MMRQRRSTSDERDARDDEGIQVMLLVTLQIRDYHSLNDSTFPEQNQRFLADHRYFSIRSRSSVCLVLPSCLWC